MGNIGSAWAHAAQAGTLAVLLAGREAEPTNDDAGAMPAEDAGLPICGEYERVDFAACVRFENQASEQTRLTGVVEAIEQPERVCPGLLHTSIRTLSTEQSYALTIRDGDVTASVQVHLPWKTPLVAIGDTVSVEHLRAPHNVRRRRVSNVEYALPLVPRGPVAGRLILRNVDGELLLAIIQVNQGFAELALPELTVSDAEHTCMARDDSCGTGTRGDIVVRRGSEELAIEYGGRAEIGDYVVLHGENMRFTAIAGACTHSWNYHAGLVAVVRR